MWALRGHRRGTLRWGNGEKWRRWRQRFFALWFCQKHALDSAFAANCARGTVTSWAEQVVTASSASLQPRGGQRPALVRPTWFTRQSTVTWGPVPTLLPGQAVRPTVPYFLSTELLMDFALLFRNGVQILLLWLCFTFMPEVKPALAIIYAPNHVLYSHNNHTTHL